MKPQPGEYVIAYCLVRFLSPAKTFLVARVRARMNDAYAQYTDAAGTTIVIRDADVVAAVADFDAGRRVLTVAHEDASPAYTAVALARAAVASAQREFDTALFNLIVTRAHELNSTGNLEVRHDETATSRAPTS